MINQAKQRILRFIAFLSGCFLLIKNLKPIINFIKFISEEYEIRSSINHILKNLQIYNLVLDITYVLLGVSIILIVLDGYKGKLKYIKNALLICLIITSTIYYSYRLTEVSEDLQNGVFFLREFIITFFIAITAFARIYLFSFSNLIINRRMRRFAYWFCISTQILYSILIIISMKFIKTGYKQPVLTDKDIIYAIIELLVYLATYGYCLKKLETSTNDYITLNMRKLSRDQGTVESDNVFIDSNLPLMSDTSSTILKQTTVKINVRKIIFISTLFLLGLCTNSILFGYFETTLEISFFLDSFNKIIPLFVITFYISIYCLFILFYYIRKLHKIKAKRASIVITTIILIISTCTTVMAGRYIVLKRHEGIYFNKLKDQVSGRSRDYWININYSNEGKTTLIWSHYIAEPYRFLFTNKRSLYKGEINTSKEININIENTVNMSVYPNDDNSVILVIRELNKKEKMYKMHDTNFDKQREVLYRMTEHGILKDDYKDLDRATKKELIIEAINILEEPNELLFNYNGYPKDIHRYKNDFIFVDIKADTFYLKGYMYNKNSKTKYKYVVDADVNEYLNREAIFINQIKTILINFQDEAYLKTINEDSKYILELRNKEDVIEMWFSKDKEILEIWYNQQTFVIKNLNNSYTDLYDYLYNNFLIPRDLSSYRLISN